MRDDASREDRDTAGLQTSSAEDLTEASIRKALRSGALQHPATLLPFALAVLALADLLIIGFSVFWAVVVLIAALLGAGVSFFWIYSFRHDVEYAKRVQEIMAIQGQESREVREAELQQLRDTLRTGFSSTNSEPELKALMNLVYEYEQLQLVLDRQDEKGSMSVAHIPGLAEETYRQGLNVLANELQLSRTIHTSNKARLEGEIVEIGKEIESLRADPKQARRIKIREETVASHRQRLEMINQQQYRVDELLYQCDRCEASLSRTRIELAALQAGGSETSVSAVTETLQRTIDQAREVQEELKRLGF